MLVLNIKIGVLVGAGISLLNFEFFSHEEYSCLSSVFIGCMLVPQINETASCYFDGPISKRYYTLISNLEKAVIGFEVKEQVMNGYSVYK